MKDAPHLRQRCPPLDMRPNARLLSLFFQGVFGDFGLIAPIKRTRSSRAVRALPVQQSRLNESGVSPSPRASPFYPGLDDNVTFGSKSLLRSKLVRSLRGSTSGSTERPAAEPTPEDLTRLNSDQLPVGGGNGAEGLSTVVEENLEDWVDDFDAISLIDVPLGVERAAGSSQTQTQLTHESDSAFASQPSQTRARTTSKTSRRSRKSSRRNTDLGELRLILDFPLPPTFIPTPPNSKTPVSIPVRLPQPEQDTPIHDDGSIPDEHDSFFAETASDIASVVIVDADIARVGSSASFYTAHSQSPSPAPSVQPVYTDPDPPPSPPPSVHPPPLSPLHLPFPHQPFPSPQQSRTETPSTTNRSIRTLTKASATLKRIGNLTRETLRTSLRTPVSELSARRNRRATTRVAHVSLDHLPQSSSRQNAERSPLLPDFQPEAFDISFPAVETPHVTPRKSRSPRAHPSVHSFFASLEEFLTFSPLQ